VLSEVYGSATTFETDFLLVETVGRGIRRTG
jgi:hypothetical protein